MPRSGYEARIRKVLAERPDETAIDFDGVPFTWGEVAAVAAAVERLIEAAGLKDGERVGLLGRNFPSQFAALWGIFVAGRCISMLYAQQPPQAVAADLAKGRWPLVLGERRDWTAEAVA